MQTISLIYWYIAVLSCSFLLADGGFPPFVVLMYLDQTFWIELLLSVSRSMVVRTSVRTGWFLQCVSFQNIVKNHISSSTVKQTNKQTKP